MDMRKLFKILDSLERSTRNEDFSFDQLESWARGMAYKYAWQHPDRPTYWLDDIQSAFPVFNLDI